MDRRLIILLTNIWFAHAGGSEAVARDLAIGVLRRGHRPIVYAPRLGPLADEVAARGVAVIDDLRRLAERPDIIHAHHAIPCGEALIRFPDVPAINVCHSFQHWVEAPVHFPQIGAYVAVDEACRDRLVHREGINPARVVVLPNAVDLQRIPTRRRPLSERPTRAIAFGKAAAVPEVFEACRRLGVECSALGGGGGQMTSYPEHELVGCDLVFASARAALEALCCGCAVIVCDGRGFGGLVTSRNFEPLRARNFGLRCLSHPVTLERCVQEIERYDRGDAALVAERARRDADFERLLDEFERLYGKVLAGRPAVSPEDHARAVAGFLHDHLPRHPEDSRWECVERDRLQAQVEALEVELGALSAAVAQPGKPGPEEPRTLAWQLATAQKHLADALSERNEAQQALARLRHELADIKRSRLLRLGRTLRKMTGASVPY
jgi:hypothetical protein